MPLEAPEKSGNPPSYPSRGSFAELLDWHLDFGTRPRGSPDRAGQRWSNKEFAGKLGVDERTVRNWRTGRSHPIEIGSIERELFGANPAFDQWRGDLRAAYDGHQEEEPQGAPIPRVPTHFLGRDRDISAILDTLLSVLAPVAIIVQGDPGIGKTALTKAIGNHKDIIGRFGPNRWFVELDAVGSAAGLQGAIARAIGADPARGFAATLAQLRQRPGLLVLDNLETPWDPVTERPLTEDILADLAATPGLALLASFRGRDRVGGPGWALIHPVTRLDPPYDAELFCRIASAAFPDDPHLPRFMTALAGIPLAIELVARRAYGAASLAALWARWVRIGAALATHPDYATGRLTSLPHSIELSLASSRMTPLAHRLFRLLGQLSAGLAPVDRDELLGADGFDAEEALLRIGLAIERSNRLDLLPPVRDHAARNHAPEAPDSLAWPSHYLDLTRRRGEAIGRKEGEGAVARLTPEFANIEAAVRAVLATGQRQQAMAALTGFGHFTSIASISSLVLGDLAAACHADKDSQGEAICNRSIGNIALARSDHAAARTSYEQALPLYRQVGDVLGEANCIQGLGHIELRRSDHVGAGKSYEAALALYHQVKDVLGEASCIYGLGDIALRRSEHAAARTFFEQALPLYRHIGSVLGKANCIKSLGHIALRRSDHAASGACYNEALPLYRQVGDVVGEANCIYGLGVIAIVRSDHAAARKSYEEALSLYRQVGDVLGEANCIYGLGNIAVECSDRATARSCYEQALPIYRQVGDVLGEASCIYSLGNIAMECSDHATARASYEQALPLYRQFGDVLGEANCIYSFGNIAFALSDHATARTYYEKALPLYRHVGDAFGEADCVRSLKMLGGDPQ